MSASNLFMSFGTVTFTYAGPTVVTIAKVTDVNKDQTSKSQPWYSDGGTYPLLIATKEKSRSVKVTSGDIAGLQGIPEDTVGTLVWVLLDAKNGTGSGAITYTLANAVMTANTAKSGVNKFGTAEVTFMAYSSDGTTDPLSKAVAP